LLGPADALNFSPVDTLLLDHALATRDQLVRARAIMALDRLRQSGATILFTSNDEDLLLELADEIWWLKEGRLIGARRSRRSPGRLSCSHHAAHPGLGTEYSGPAFATTAPRRRACPNSGH
jgi:energy-coupling factor transporter ATP-binding protein EcfA2